MRIRPASRLACAAVACALAVGPGALSGARAQSLIEALSRTYNSNPDLLAQRALLRQTDETLAQAVANWRPRVSLSVEYNKIEFDALPQVRPNTYLALNGRTTLLSVTQPVFRGPAQFVKLPPDLAGPMFSKRIDVRLGLTVERDGFVFADLMLTGGAEFTTAERSPATPQTPPARAAESDRAGRRQT